MMKWITTFCMICISLLEGYSESIQTADSLRQNQEYDLARLTYERIIYSSADNVSRTEALLGKAQCYLDENDFDGAQYTVERIVFFGLTDSLMWEARSRAGLAAFLNGNFEAAESQLLVANQMLPDSITIQGSPLYALTLNELGKWDEAKTELITWINWRFEEDSLIQDSLQSMVEMVYSEKGQSKYRDPKKADLWATLLPGTGQLYSGYFFDGAFTALMVASGIGVAALGVFVVKYYVTGLVLGYGIYQRFYTAGIKRSEFLARKRNYQRNRAYNDCLQAIVIDLQNIEP